MSQRDKTTELFELALRALEGSATDGQVGRLEELLAGDPTAVKRYVRFMMLYTGLARGEGLPMSESGSTPADDPRTDSALLGTLAEDGAAEHAGLGPDISMVPPEKEWRVRAHEETIRMRAAELLDSFKERERLRQEELAYRRWRRERRRLLIGAGSLAAVLVIVVCTYLSSLSSSRPPRVPSPPAVAPPPPVLARITDSLDAQWRQRNLSTEPGTELTASFMDLKRGLVRITFNCGADVILEAPAEIQIDAVDQMLLGRGRLAARAGGNAIGFTVRTPGATVVDYGTEFGVSVSRSGRTEAHVFKGQVEVRSGPSVRVFETSRRLTAQQACVVDGEGRLLEASLAASPESFQRHIPSPYELAVRDSRPVAYWRFDADDPNQFVDVLNPRVNLGRLTGPVGFSAGPGLGDGKLAQAVLFDGNVGRAAVRDIVAPEAGRVTGYAYAMWVRPDAIRHQFILGSINQDTRGARRVLAMTADGRFDHYFVDGNGSEVARIQSRTVARLGVWYHVVVARTGYGDRMLFVNGVLDGSAVASTYSTPSFNDELYLGAMADTSLMAGLAPWQGALGEVAVYGRVLGEEEVRRLYVSSQER